jgi:SPP1 gp7 family putative phage head morphogenesis protein
MDTVITYTETFRKNYDPTHTTVLRNAFSSEMKKRFKELMLVIYKAIVVQDCFGLSPKIIQSMQMTVPGEGAFSFIRSSAKVESFMKWLEEQVSKGILSVQEYQQIGSSINAAWTNMYLSDSYKRGVIRARYEMKKAGLNIPSVEDSGGIDMLMGLPYHVDRLGLIFIRAFNDLKGITNVMDSQISRVLAQGLADGDGMRLIARKLLSTVNGTGADVLGITDTLGRFIPAARRAELLARTEIIRAHHVATIQEYRNWGVEGVTVLGEWKTAGADRVCSKCAQMEGKIFTLDEIEPLIPLHPLCRCIALPYIEELQKYK